MMALQPLSCLEFLGVLVNTELPINITHSQINTFYCYGIIIL